MNEYLELLNGIRDKKLTCNYAILCELDSTVIEFLRCYEISPFTKKIYITHKGLSHLMRDSKKRRGAGAIEDDLERLPLLLCNADAVIFDTQSSRLNLLYISHSNEKYIKIVVNPKGYDKKMGKLTLVQTAGMVQKENLHDKRYRVIKGAI